MWRRRSPLSPTAALLALGALLGPTTAAQGRSAAMPFMIGDVWRGFLSSCHQSEVHQEREFRTFPFDLTIQKTNAPLGVVHVTFVSHYDKTEYRMKGIYNESVYRLFLRPEHSDISSAGWKPCDAEAFLSHDFSTLAGVSLCADHGECDAGGGEFVLRHDRTRFRVAGAGHKHVDGVYSSLAPGHSILETETYAGAPVYAQDECAHGDDDYECGNYVLVHKVHGQFGFWWIVHARALAEESDVGPLYSAWSEDAYPPSTGWRPHTWDDAPAPDVSPVVTSLYADSPLDGVHLRASAARHAGSGAGGAAATAASRSSTPLVLSIGALLWVLVLVVKRRKSTVGPGGGRRFR